MMTTLRSDRRTRRTRRNATFNLEYLDDRIVLSAASAVAVAEAHLAADIASGHTKAADKAAVTLHRDEVRLAKVEANHHIVSAAPTATATVTSPSGSVSAAAVADPVAVNSTATSSPTAATTGSSSTTTTAPTGTTVSFNPTTTATTATTTSTQAVTTPASSSSSSTTTLPANVSALLQSLYQQFESAGGGTFTPTGMNGIIISGSDVGVNIQTSNSADFNTLLSQLQSDGLQVTSDSATYGIIDGLLPIAQLPAVGQISPAVSVAPLGQPQMR